MNYLALIGWSPGGDQELLPIEELARRFALEDVGHSAGVFDQEKLAWMNRHYMKEAAPARLAAEAARYFLARGYMRRRTDEGMEYLISVLPMAVGSVDRLEEMPDRAEVSVRLRSGGRAGARGGGERAARSRRARRDYGAAGCDRAPARSIASRFARWRTASRSGPGRKGRRSFIRSASR